MTERTPATTDAGPRRPATGESSQESLLPEAPADAERLDDILPATSFAAVGAFLGAAAGLITALSDFGAMWLWLQLWGDRVAFLARLMLTQVPAGALMGAAVGSAAGAMYALTRSRPVRVRRRLVPLAPTLLLSPLAAAVGYLLFTGGQMSALPNRTLWAGLATLVLSFGLYSLFRGGAALGREVLAPKPRRTLGILGLVVSAVLAKADQIVLPNLYEYLHGVLTFLQFAAAFFATWMFRAELIARFPALRRAASGWVAMVFTATALVIGVGALTTLERNQNVRVALGDPRASNSRSLMLALEPILSGSRREASEAAIARARARRAARHRHAQAEPDAAVAEASPSSPESHILLISIDALRADHLGAYGYERGISPEIDALAAESVRFEHAYATAPHSSYSLSSLMTSVHLHQTTRLGQPVPEATLASTLTDSGFQTAALFTLGIFHTEGENLHRYEASAFDYARHEHANLDAEERTDAALEEIDRVIEAGEPPSLHWVHYFDVHEPYQDTRLGTSDLDRYDSEIAHVDAAVGRLLREARTRLQRPVIVVLTADHGEEFRDHGGVYHGSTLFEEQIRVPLLIHAPGYDPAIIPAPVELIDVPTTLLGLVDVPAPESMRGDDLRPLMRGDVQELGPVFAAVSRERMVVDWPFKLIADLRFNAFELYNLSTDPEERVNLADAEPDRLDALRGEIYAWIDELQSLGGEALTPHEQALSWGRMHDRRAVESLGTLLSDEQAAREMRVEAAQLIGRLSDARSKPAVFAAMSSEDSVVAAEAAIALGRLYDDRAREALVTLVGSEEVDLRIRAAVSLARLRDVRAVPALLDTLRLAEDTYEREESVRWLGRLQDTSALEPLLAVLPEFRYRTLGVIALGMLGDPRAFEPLTDILEWESHMSVRDAVCRALGQLGDLRALPLLIPVAAREAELSAAPESIVRLGGLDRGVVGGLDADAATGRRERDLSECTEDPERHDWNYLSRTHCETRGSRARLRLALPDDLRGQPLVLIARARRVDSGAPLSGSLRVLAAGRGVGEAIPWTLPEAWSEVRMTLPAGALARGRVTVEVQMDEGRVDIDHILLIPAASETQPDGP